ncbi:hypothetical protein T484DRAFT_1896997 [Baffinella frigidus]|nr:hypothetical protein T484DRAFT_1896997 [Cryptophyta sp. CCMP2293]
MRGFTGFHECQFCADGQGRAEAGAVSLVGEEDKGDPDVRKRCPVFKTLKAGTSRESYLKRELKPRDEAGFAAAGVLLFRRSGATVEVLMAREYRERGRSGGDLLNFLGGKRLAKSEDAVSVAIRKINLETGGQLSPATLARMQRGFPLVYWSAESKYVLYLWELKSTSDLEVDVSCMGVRGSKRLEWTSRDDLYKARFASVELHRFAAEMLSQIIRSDTS